jgi:hypothetical protein
MNRENDGVLEAVSKTVLDLCKKFPVNKEK